MKTQKPDARYDAARREFDQAIKSAEAAGEAVITRDQVPHFDDMLEAVRELQALHRSLEK